MILQTERLVLREMVESDAAFILQLLNEPSFLQYIGDKGVRTVEDAQAYIRGGPVASYSANGHGLYLVVLRDSGTPIGMCGLVTRPTLAVPDIGFAFMPAYWSQGYAVEAAQAVMDYARDALGVKHIVAIASPDNTSSARLLGKIGLKFNRLISTADGGADVALFTPSGFDDGEIVRATS